MTQFNPPGPSKARIIMTGLVFFGFIISGITEHSITVALTSYSSFGEVKGDNNGTQMARRYCDPPNMTALVIYYDSSEEVKDYDGYDFSQLQEMLFQVCFYVTKKERELDCKTIMISYSQLRTRM